MTESSEVLQDGQFQIVHGVSTVRKINNLLNSPKTRADGLILLSSYIPQCSYEDFIEFCVSWMQNCCKVDGLQKSNDFAVGILNNLFRVSSNYPELNKSVSFFITTRFFDYFFKHLLESQPGWLCAEACFVYYRGSCGPSQETFEKHLNNELKKNFKISSVMARCYALLPCLGGGGNYGVNYKKNWKAQMVKFINISHSILDDLFADVEELQTYDSIGQTYSQKGEGSIEYFVIQLYNYCSILNYMLMNKYPAPKCIPTDLILQLVCRGLAVNPKNVGKNNTTNLIKLRKVLPDVHVILHSLLNALVVTCKSNLLPYSFLICKLIRQTLEWTETEIDSGSEKPLGDVRISAYETLYNWQIASGSGSSVESISATVIVSAFNDIQSKEKVVQLKDHKKKNQLNFENEKSRRVHPTASSSLCVAALKAVQYLLNYVGVLLKPEEHKFLQRAVIKLLSDLQNSSPTNVLVPYSMPACRKGLYSVLLELTNQSCQEVPPPTHFALRLFARGQMDKDAEVSHFCRMAFNVLTNIIHPQYGSAEWKDSSAPETTSVGDGRRMEGEWSSELRKIDPNGYDASVSFSEGVEKMESQKAFSLNITESKLTRNESEEKNDTDNLSESFMKLPSQEIFTEYPTAEGDVGLEENDEKEESEEILEEPTPKKRKSLSEAMECQSGKENGIKTSPTKGVESLLKEKEEDIKKFEKNSSKDKTLEEKVEKLEWYLPENRSSETESKKHDENASEHKTPERKMYVSKRIVENATEEVSRGSTTSPEGINEEERHLGPKKRYFLRSKTCQETSEEPEEFQKRGSSPESTKNTPVRSSVKNTPSTLRKKRKTRASSRLETLESESESVSSKKDGNDNDEDIIESFRDSPIE